MRMELYGRNLARGGVRFFTLNEIFTDEFLMRGLIMEDEPDLPSVF